MRILLIEDDWVEAEKIKAVLEGLGHQVVWITGVCGTPTAERVSGYLFFRGCRPPNGIPQQVIELREFELALVDGVLFNELEQKNHSGADLVPYLIEAGVVCIGISGDAHLNECIKRSGAKMVVPKSLVVAYLGDGRLDLNAVLGDVPPFGEPGATKLFSY